MEKWLLEQGARIDACVLQYVPGTWPTLSVAYQQASGGKIAIETLLGILTHRLGKQLSDDSIHAWAAVQSAAIGMRMLQAANTGIDPENWVTQWGIALTRNYGHGLTLLSSAIVKGCELPSAQKQSLQSLLSDSYLSFLSAQDVVIEGAWHEQGDFEEMIFKSWGALGGLGLCTASILRMDASAKLRFHLHQGQCIGQTLHLLHLAVQIRRGELSEMVWLWAMQHSLEYDHPARESLESIAATPQSTWNHAQIAALWQEINLPQLLLGTAQKWADEACQDEPRDSELRKFLDALMAQS